MYETDTGYTCVQEYEPTEEELFDSYLDSCPDPDLHEKHASGRWQASVHTRSGVPDTCHELAVTRIAARPWPNGSRGGGPPPNIWDDLAVECAIDDILEAA